MHPREARRVPKIGGTKDPDLARLRELRPTHLIVNVDENRREVVDAARKFVPHVIVTHPADPSDNPRLYALFGAIFGREHEAAVLARGLRGGARGRRGPGEPAAARTGAVRDLAQAVDDGCARHLRQRDAGAARMGHAARQLDGALSGTGRRRSAVARRAAHPAVDRAFCVYAHATRRRSPCASRKPVELVDGEWTSWYGVRAIGGLAGACAYAQCARRTSMKKKRPPVTAASSCGVTRAYSGTRIPTVTAQ